MKKLLVFLLALVMCLSCFAACTTPGNGDETTDGGNEGGEPTLAEAVEYLRSIYKDNAKETPVDYDVVGKIVIGETTFDVTWTTSLESITVKVSEKNSSFYTVDIPVKNDTVTDYTLTATVKDAAGNSETLSFERALPVYDSSAIVERPEDQQAYKFYLVHASLGQTLYATGATQDGGNKYILTTTDPKAAPDFYTEADGEGFKFYTTIDGVKNYVYAKTTTSDDGKVSKYIGYSTEEGTTWTYKSETNAWYTMINGLEYVVGTYGTYNTICISDSSFMTPDTTGKTQFPAGLIKKDVAESMTPSEGPTIYKTPEEIVNAAYELELNGVLSGGHKYTLTGVITDIPNPWSDDYGNITVVIVVNGMTDKPIECFRLKGDGANKLAVGDTITVTGELLKYDNKSETGKVEFNAGCTLVSGSGSGSGDNDQPSTPSQPSGELKAQSPVAGTVYKFGFLQGNKNQVYYLTGVLSGFYMASTETFADGADFYVEATEGGFHLYCMVNGAKKYVNAKSVVGTDGKNHINGLFEDTASSVYTYDETLKTLVTAIDGENYLFGTKADGTFTTLGPMKASSGCFYAVLVTEAASAPSTPETPDTPDTPDTPVTPDVPSDAETMVIYFPKDGKYVTGIEYEYTSSKGTKKMQLVLTANKAEALAFSVITNDDGTLAFMAEGKYLMADGTNVELVASAGENTLFVMEEADGGHYIRCNTANFQGKAQYLEVYSGYLTCYGMGTDPSIYVFELQDGEGANGKVQELGSTTPVEPETPSTPETPVTGNNVVLSVDTLEIASQTYAAGTTTLNGVGFEYIQMGNYGNGLQMRDKNGNTSSIWNTTAINGGIARIELVYSDSMSVQYANPDAVVFTFGNAVGEATCTTKLSTTAGVKTYTITPDAGSYTFFKLEHDLGYTFYWKSITIVFTDGSTASIG